MLIPSPMLQQSPTFCLTFFPNTSFARIAIIKDREVRNVNRLSCTFYSCCFGRNPSINPKYEIYTKIAFLYCTN